jgi:hypothetical protein
MTDDEKTQIVKKIIDTADDITAYFEGDTPLECHQYDIGVKLQSLIDEIHALPTN